MYTYLICLYFTITGKKHVIKGVSGCFKAGEMTAIMGPSGAGKSSLLNILTGFREAEGTIRCTGPLQNRRGAKQHSKYSCYILQDDSLDPLFTVEETMKIAAELKLGRKVSEKAKQFLIEDILEALLLIPCRNTRCQMISGGQKKRLSVALELIGNPSVLFLDEPTTGLDSSSSKQVITVLKTLVQQGRNIICTIHQPSASLFELFDFVYVMAEGKCIYQGSSTNVVSYLASFDLNCPKYHNPADYLLEVANGDYGKFTDLLEIKGIEKKWRNYTKTENRSENNYIYREDGDNQISIPQYEPSEAFKLWVLIKKALKKQLEIGQYLP
ncbi:hypothetical protein HHI36_010355 [Cryptolaemus montrouzieri]|uniref:ABC transporter domain-containing protein n=1 Tax=Cryptolaemus montrouzieri TaxID=559131 RepID=A0ABD2MJ86_9CUCU